MRLLLVEDDELLGDALKTGLTQFGFVVDWVTDGESALLALKTESFDLIILDLIMPGQDGFDTLEKLRSAPLTKRTPIVIFSTLSQKEDIDKVINSGANGHVPKYGDSIENIVQKILDNAK